MKFHVRGHYILDKYTQISIYVVEISILYALIYFFVTSRVVVLVVGYLRIYFAFQVESKLINWIFLKNNWAILLK